MKIKQLLRHTTILLRTALLLGAIAFVNVQQAQAQTAAQRAEMPDAFETIDPTQVDWSQEPYFYIQFDEGNVHSFLGEFGLTNLMHAKDYVPFAKNIQWTLVPTGTAGQYYLKSRNGNYLRQWPSNPDYCGASPDVNDDRYKFTLTSLSDGYYELLRDVFCLGRENGNEWGRIRVGFNPGSPRARLRFAKLKSNIAHIIYYRGEHADGKDNIGDDSSQPWNPSATETRHYLTYSGADYGTRSLIDNGTLEGNDASCFFSPNGNTQSTITNVGRENSRGIKVESSGDETYEHDTQFFIKAKNIIPIGTTVRVDFDYRADVDVKGIGTQAQAQPSQYNHWDVIGSINFTTNWQHFSKEFVVTEDMGNNTDQGRNNTFQTIAFNLGKKAATSFYFDNIVFTFDDADVSSRQSIIPKNKSLWTLPTAAAYHQDGLWALEPVGNNGEFYIKKYGTEEYLNVTQSGTQYFSDLGAKDALFGKYKLEDPNANRYTAIQNTQYSSLSLTESLFKNWNGCGAGASSTGAVNSTDNFDFRFKLGTQVNSGDAIVGTDNVGYLTYADLGDNTKMVINGTAGMQLRVLMNRQEGPTGNVYQGPYVEKNVTIGSDGRAVVDLTYLELNASTTGSATVKMTYINGSDNSVGSSFGEVPSATAGYNNGYKWSTGPGYSISTVGLGNKDWGVNNIIYLQVNASAIPGRIAKVTLKANASGNADRETEWGAGYTNMGWSSDMTWNSVDAAGGRNITDLTPVANRPVVAKNATNEISLDITNAIINDPDKIATIVVYETRPGGGMFSNPTVEVEYYPTYTYRHLNTIKAGWGSPSGTVSSISFVNENSLTTTDARYLHYDKGDGYLVKQWTTEWNDCWYAGFYPVEVPVPNKDNYYQVLVHIPVLNGNPILNYDGWATGDETKLWQLEQVGDYRYFRLKEPSTGKYLAGVGQMTAANDPNGESAENANKAEISDNKKFLTDYSLTWVFKNPTPKEIVVNGFVRHKVSYLRDYAKSSVIPDQEGLKKQGLSRDVDSDWKEFENKVTEKPFLLDGFIQKTNYFEITHYLKKGDSKVIEFPTVLNHNNDHIFFQRFYHYDEDDTQMDLDNLKAHVSLDTRDDGDVQYFLYKNGMVTGQKLNWTGIDDGGFARNEQRRFNFTNSDGNTFNVGVDVARYSDLFYKDSIVGDVTYHNLYEPSLTMRYLFYMNDAKEMATKLTACPEGSGKWLESKDFHFGRTQVPYTKFKKVGYRGEFVPIRHIFSDYWVYDDPEFVKNDANGNAIIDTLYITNNYGAMTNEQLSDFLDQHLVSAVNDNSSGKIEVEIDDPNHTGIRKGGYNPNLNLNDEGYDDYSINCVDDSTQYQGFYFYDKLSPNPKTEYGNSRFVVFRYPRADKNGIIQVAKCGPDYPAYINVYLNNGGTRYQVAQFKLIFDANMATRPWTQIKNGTHYANGTDSVKNTVRDPNQLRLKAGNPIAKVTFDYPKSMNISDGNATYHYPSGVTTRHHGGDHGTGDDTTIANSSPVPLTFGHTNYSFDGDYCNWGSYAMVTNMETHYGNQKIIVPADDDIYGYGIDADPGMQKAFLYIDASEQPGDICAMEFEGEFCANDQLMCTGWISGSNKIRNDTRCPGSITLTVKGEDAKGKTNTIYRFCPGQIYELDNGYQKPGATTTNELGVVGNAGIDGNGNNATHVVWQQFYFEFSTDQKYERYWLEVNNNCVSSNGGDFMLDNVEVYTIVPEVEPEINTPICVKRDANNNIVYDMRFLKLKVDYNKLKSSIIKKESTSSETTTDTPYLGIVFLEKEKFLRKLRTELGETDLSLEEMAERVENGYYDNTINGGDEAYQNAFKAALLRSSNTNENIWKSDDESPILGSGILYYKWDKTFVSTLMPEYTFKDAVNKTSAVYRYTEEDVDYIILNGNFPELPWKTNTDYYIVPSNTVITTFGQVYEAFNICSSCSKANVFQIEPPYTVLGLESAETTSDYVVCEGQKPTMLLDLKGYDYNGDEIDMKDLNYDWWLGNATTKATLENYHLQHKTIDSEDVYLDKALSTLRAYYPNITSLDGVAVSTKTPNLTTPMVKYLRELVNAGELVLHQKSISVPAEAAGEEDPYFYIVACPIHDEMFKQALNSTGTYSAVKNGDMERKDVSSFFMGDPTTNGIKVSATLTDGVGKNGSRGVSIPSSGNSTVDAQQDHDTQFFIKAKERIPIGTKFHLEFDCKASADATVSTQAHSTPGNYNDYVMLGDLELSTDWNHFEFDITVSEEMGNGRDPNNSKNNSFQTIAFNLWKTRSEITYYFDNVVFTYPKKQYVSFYCDEPQGYRVKVGEKAPTLKTGFVPNENGFGTYNYPENSDPVLSIRLAKKEQFEKVQHGSVNDNPADTYSTTAEASKHFLWLPIRNAKTQTASGVIRKSADYNIYLSSTNDPTWDKEIYTAMRDGALPIVGKIVQLKAINTTGGTNLNGQNAYNRLCVYFTENFEVREGYNYVLSLPFQEEPDNEGNAVNACDGTILINLKIVPDYEVWTGAAGNTDWNNDDNWRRADGNTSPRWNANDELYVGAAKAPSTPDAEDGSPLYGYKTNDWNYRTDNDRVLRKGFAPLYCTHVLMKSDEWGNAPQLYDAIDTEGNTITPNTTLQKSPFPNLRDEDGWDGTTGENATKATATPILRYDMQARLYDIWPETYGQDVYPNKGRTGDLIAEMYQINSCDEIAFQPGTELRYAHLLNYNNAWVEYQLDNKRWYLLGSPLQGTISGEWYASTGKAKQETTYYDPVTFGAGYDRYSPAIYQRSWDKAKAVLYEVGATWNSEDDSQVADGSALQGIWGDADWNATGADRYLDRLGYKPMGGNKANVAIKGVWSNTYNDAQVDYATGGFSVMVMNHLKNNDSSGGKSIIRLPKEDTMYDYYKFSEDGSDNGGTDTNLSDVRGKGRAKNRGRLKTDLLLPATVTASENTVNIKKQEGTASRYGDQRDYTRIPIHEDALTAMNTALASATFTEKVAAGATATEAEANNTTSTLNYYLVENPFACGLDMDKFFEANSAKLIEKYWLLTETGQHLVQKAKDVVPSEWISPSGDDFATAYKVLAPGQGFFVEAKTGVTGDIDIVFNKDMQVQSRYGVKSGTGRTFEIEVGREQVTHTETVDVDGDEVGETVTVIDYEDDGVTPKTNAIMADVVIYDYVQTSDADKKYPLLARTTRGEAATNLPGMVITAKRGDDQSNALVRLRSNTSNDFLPEEDTETFINSDLEQTPTVYTLCGRLATTINSIHDFRSLPVGVESTSDAPCTLTFQGVELLGDSVAFYDAVKQELTPLESGMQFAVSGQTQNRYYLVRSLDKKEAAEETHLQIFTEGMTAKVIASTAEPILNVRCFDTGGRLIHEATPQSQEYSFNLPMPGIYIIEAETANDNKTKKVLARR